MNTQIEGFTDPRFEAVADAFRLNFSDRNDRGAACAIMLNGQFVVDLWGGEAREGVPWERETLTPVFSVSKAVTAVAMLSAVDEGVLDLDEPVATYWPEFGANGKDRITVRQTLAHRAGVPSFGQPWNADELAAWDLVVQDLAAQEPLWEPGESFAYHAISVGFIAGEIFRRVSGRTVAEWLPTVCEALSIDVSYGRDVRDARVARVAPPLGAAPAMPIDPALQPLLDRVFLADAAYGPDLFTSANTRRFLEPLSPAANVVGSARDLAVLFAATVAEVNGVRLVSQRTLDDARRPVTFGRPFVGEDVGQIWGAGFLVHSAKRPMAGKGSFGHDGAGGQLVFANEQLGLSFAYQTNQYIEGVDVRADALCSALRESL